MATLAGFSRLFNFATNTCIRRIKPISIYKQYYPALKLWNMEVAGYKTIKQMPWFREPPSYQERVIENTEEMEKAASDVLSEINKQIATNTTGRLFAVVHVGGQQFKVTESDVIIISGHWPPQPGEKIKLEKVLVVGSKDFSLIGRPVLNRELVSVDATVVQKTLSHTITRFRMKRRKQFRRLNFMREHRTMLRITSITIEGDVDETKEVEGLNRIY
ncbi:mitochondrial ribosomal protein L21 isoform X1 [Megalopta genalis]|uniref:mitochondrial ribosomal protein L21 isoform X1 n=2 Tax=Megalopta genalis TaxID=115081 RepID=UPI003FCF0C04